MKRPSAKVSEKSYNKFKWEDNTGDIISVDGVHCRIQEVRKDPGAKCRHDITTLRGEDDPGKGLIDQIPDGMRGIGDSAYRSEPTKMSVSQRGDGLEVKKFKARVKARQETLFSRLKAFNILNHAFRHGFDAHKQCFEACSVAVQFNCRTTTA
ncbi:hypothetical protein IV203_018830 [Nitzschia inconspicua]|uniref:Uncharacterized protein n=1 Tax=Nitzschia inconspicua TaxID=303405 RepID=A0A9K3Q5W9_9STRA|nr:hypothetical protein IV203_018830 [Nitzschia inconspicua]